MINIWYKVKKHMKILHSLSQFSPVWGNASFKPGKLDAGFKLWAKNRLIKIADLYKEEVLMSLEEISNCATSQRNISLNICNRRPLSLQRKISH